MYCWPNEITYQAFGDSGACDQSLSLGRSIASTRLSWHPLPSSNLKAAGHCQALASLPTFLIAGIAFLASSSVSKPITAANFRPITCATKKAMLMPAVAIVRAII